jgi:hypothetical protein
MEIGVSPVQLWINIAIAAVIVALGIIALLRIAKNSTRLTAKPIVLALMVIAFPVIGALIVLRMRPDSLS